MTLAQATDIMLEKYEGINDDDQSLMQISAVPHSDVWTLQGQSGQPGNMQT